MTGRMGALGLGLLLGCGARFGASPEVAAPLVLAPASGTTVASRWRDAAELPALDGEGRWALKLDENGTIHRVRGGAHLEPMNDRLSLPRRVRAIESFGR